MNGRIPRCGRGLLAGVLVSTLGLAALARGADDELRRDLEARRGRVLERLGPEALLILWAAPVRTYSHDIEHEYRQDSNFYYLTGVEQPDSALVLMPGNETRKSILFIARPDPLREHWEGKMLRKAEARALSGIETVYYTDELEPFLDRVLSGRPYDVDRYAGSTEYDRFFAALRSGAARLALVLDRPPALAEPPSRAMAFARRVEERFPGVGILDATEILASLRQIKTPYERRLLVEAGRIASEGHRAGMRAARPGVYEYEVEAAIEAVYKKRGAYGPSYPSIVASGPNATILHYSASTRRLEPGDLLLVDSAANYRYMTVDITRTYPVDGVFTQAQKDIYRIVLAAQDAGLRAARPGTTLDAIHRAVAAAIAEGLASVGLVTDPSTDEYKTWFTHGACHWIGMDVHDVGIRSRPLEPGMAFVIEPGVYVREDALDHLPDTAEQRAFRERVRPAVEKYRDIGIRIEDSFLVTEKGIESLSADVPRTIEAIEALLRDRPSESR